MNCTPPRDFATRFRQALADRDDPARRYDSLIDESDSIAPGWRKHIGPYTVYCAPGGLFIRAARTGWRRYFTQIWDESRNVRECQQRNRRNPGRLPA